MERVKFCPEGWGHTVYARLQRTLQGGRGKNPISRGLKSGRLYVQRRSDTSIALRFWNTDICTAHADGRLQFVCYDSKSTRRHLEDCIKVRFSSVSNMRVNIKYTIRAPGELEIPYIGTINVDAQGFTDAYEITRVRTKRSVLAEARRKYKPYARLIDVQVALSAPNTDEQGQRIPYFGRYIEANPDPTMDNIMAVLDHGLARCQPDTPWRRSEDRANLTSAAKCAREEFIKAYMNSHDGYEDAPYDIHSRAYRDGKKF